MKFSDYSGSQWLTREDLEGAERNVTITGFTEADVRENDGQTKRKLVMEYEEKDPPPGLDPITKPMILNKTNTRILREIYATNDPQDAIGKRVTIYDDLGVTFGGKRGGLRLRECIDDDLPASFG